MTDDVVNVRFTTQYAELQSGLETIDTSSRQTAQALGALDEGAKKGAGGLSFLTEGLKDHKSEMRQESGLARILSRDLAALGLDAKGAGGAIAGVVSSFAVGGGLGLALEGVKLIGERFREAKEQVESAKEATRSYLDGIQKSVLGVDEAWDDLITRMNTTHDSDAQRQGAEERIRLVREEAEEIRKRDQAGDEIANKLGEDWRSMRDKGSDTLRAWLQDIIAKNKEGGGAAAKAFLESFSKISAIQVAKDELPRRVPEAQAAEYRANQEKVDEAVHAEIRKGQGEEERLRSELDDRLAKLDLDKGKYSADQYHALRKAEEDAGNRAIEAAREKHHQELAALELRYAEVGMSERQRVEAQGAAEIDRLKGQQRLAKGAGDTGEVARLQRMIDLQRQLTAAETEQLQIKERVEMASTKKKGDDAAIDQEAETERVNQEAILRIQKEYDALRQSGYDQGIATHLASLEKEEKQAEAIVNSQHAQGKISETQYQQDILAIQTRFALDRQKLVQKSLTPVQKIETDAVHQVGAVWQRGLQGILEGHVSFGQAVEGIFESVEQAATGAIAKIAMDWLEKQAIELIEGKTTALAQIESAAAIGGANAAAVTAAIPIIGPELAPEAGAAMFADILSSFGGLASASGGFDVGNFSNPVAQLHKREMVLPEEHADTIRNLKGMAAGGSPQIHFHNNSMDPKSHEAYVTANQDVYVRVIQRAMRDGKFNKVRRGGP